MVSDVLVWHNGANTVLNVTVFHTPQTSFHYLDRVEVDLNGDNRIFPVDSRPETIFIVTCDLGVIDSPMNATIRAHCIVDGYSLLTYGPILVPEFPIMMLLALFMIATPLAFIIHKKKTRIH